jgi:hypothetical protein
VLSTSAVAGAALEEQLVSPHDSVDALWVHALGSLAVQQRGHAAVPVTRPLPNKLANAGQ